jgi:hypothetical protein
MAFLPPTGGRGIVAEKAILATPIGSLVSGNWKTNVKKE